MYNNCPAYNKCCNSCNGFHHFAKMYRKKSLINEIKVMKAQEVRVEIIDEENVF